VDLDQMAVDQPTVTTADHLDVAVGLVVPAADERRVPEGRDMPVA
jgi:hypothetical protein